jgi:hypothetical protein
LYGCDQTKALLIKDDLKYKLDVDTMKLKEMLHE